MNKSKLVFILGFLSLATPFVIAMEEGNSVTEKETRTIVTPEQQKQENIQYIILMMEGKEIKIDLPEEQQLDRLCDINRLINSASDNTKKQNQELQAQIDALSQTNKQLESFRSKFGQLHDTVTSMKTILGTLSQIAPEPLVLNNEWSTIEWEIHTEPNQIQIDGKAYEQHKYILTQITNYPTIPKKMELKIKKCINPLQSTPQLKEESETETE